ncbi:uncharacterized protein TM35_001291040 [Trypanosoma theileri]|uniref:Uncharacterized protein n=1 Tax=Trypanosoma theileri TaxID=67003 RepID=A0A1X0NF21_9TRYP|nr:uncharacterized protein TM35_001291040 [Trypanosoma theileri]ORC81141.1 hypothetical protein TM35_001291040 [Trypanosoma theileri]
MVVFDSQTTQHCEVDNANVLSTLTLRVGYYNNDGLNLGWPASLVEGTNLISFVPDRGAISENMSLVIVNTVQGKGSIPVSNNFTMSFVYPSTTLASFNSNSAYYGLKTMVQTNFPNINPIQNYLLVPPQSDCYVMAKKMYCCYWMPQFDDFCIPSYSWELFTLLNREWMARLLLAVGCISPRSEGAGAKRAVYEHSREKHTVAPGRSDGCECD